MKRVTDQKRDVKSVWLGYDTHSPSLPHPYMTPTASDVGHVSQSRRAEVYGLPANATDRVGTVPVSRGAVKVPKSDSHRRGTRHSSLDKDGPSNEAREQQPFLTANFEHGGEEQHCQHGEKPLSSDVILGANGPGVDVCRPSSMAARSRKDEQIGIEENPSVDTLSTEGQPLAMTTSRSSCQEGRRRGKGSSSSDVHRQDTGAQVQSSRQVTTRLRNEEVKRLARSMANSIENLIDNLHGIVGDLRQLVVQIDNVTDSIDASCSGGKASTRDCNSTMQRRNEVRAESSDTFTQTDHIPRMSLDCHSSLVVDQRHSLINASHRFSYPQCSRDPVPSDRISSKASDTERKSHKRSKLSRKSRDGSRTHNRVEGAVLDTPYSDRSPDPDVPRRHSHGGRRRPKSSGHFNGATLHTQDSGSISFVSRQSPTSLCFVQTAESPPNPAPALFWAYREEKTEHAKDSENLPDSGLKNWREMMETHGGSTDSLTPLMDWSYLALTDHGTNALSSGFRFQRNDQRHDRGSPIAESAVRSSRTDPGRPQKVKLTVAGMRDKLRAGGIAGIPENSEPCDSGCSDNGGVFLQTLPQDAVRELQDRFSGEGSPHNFADMNGAHNPGSFVHISPSTMCRVANPQYVNPGCGARAFPQVKQSVGGATLGWNTSSKALPGWPNEDLSSVGASDSDVDDLSSPFLSQHFQYPRTSSATDPGPEPNSTEALHGQTNITDGVHKQKNTLGCHMTRTSSATDTIASGGFEVQAEMETSPESDATSCCAGLYETVMETRLERLSNKAEGSDFSDADADVGSDVLEQSLTSLEDVSTSAKYDREVNTWTSYTMTHIDSDDVVSDCTSDILNENVLDVAATNPGFDDVSLYLDDVGFPPFPLQQCGFDQMNASLE